MKTARVSIKRWLIPTLIVCFAAFLRLWKITSPKKLVFDELYYVRDAWSQLQLGFPGEWSNDEPVFNAEVAATMLCDPSYVAHPPLGKWMISVGMLMFGVDDGLGWRFSTALAGVLTVAALIYLAFLLTNSAGVASISGLLLAVDGVHITLSRVSLLDVHLTLLVLTAAIFVVKDHQFMSDRIKRVVRTPQVGFNQIFRPWLWLAAGFFGLAAAVKWSGLYPFLIFMLVVLVQDYIFRWRIGQTKTYLQSSTQVPLAIIAFFSFYLLTWSGWIFSSTGWGRNNGSWFLNLLNQHIELVKWHATLKDEHPYASNPLTWPFGLKPTNMFFEHSGDLVSAISPVPNLLVTWGSFFAIIFFSVFLLRLWFRNRNLFLSSKLVFAGAVAVVGFLSGWLPWVVTFSRSSVFQFYMVVTTPFAALALALLLGALSSFVNFPGMRFNAASLVPRRVSVAIFLVSAVLLSLYFWPNWSGALQPEMWWRAKLWLPEWR